MSIDVNCLDLILEEFKEKIFYIQSSSHFIKGILREASENSRTQYEKEKTWKVGIHSSDTHTMTCKDIFNGGITKIESKEFSIDEYSQIYEEIRNKQYQWLLVGAYEAYENYLKKLYSYIGFIDHDFWQAKDFGSISLNEIKNNDLSWFVNRLEKDRIKNTNDISKQIYKKMPILKKILAIRKRDDPRKIDYEFMIQLITQLRHIIVHNNGTTDKSEFIKELLKEIGRNNNKSEDQNYIDIVNWYFGIKKMNNTVCLTEVHDPHGKFMHCDRLNDLVEVIASYAILMHDIAKMHLESKTNKD
ncbi:MAG: hypothetical protein K2Y09_04705 [Nitrosomonas sp.]|uniref:hypothetical protein n=1 Tax=Nitrosomonas sp. TaxID=42353 RepID=UPI001D37DA1F|nr:hypothetical protein [Nitrosomonas sp.]MBX9894466.1 hypothetical protein [Nitrosomonas sp.]